MPFKKYLIYCLVLITSSFANAQNIVSGEYFLDNDPGIGNGTAFSLSGGTTVNQVISLPTTGMNEGFHTMYIRVKDDLGKWSHYEKTSFYVLKNQSGAATPPNLIAGEYFLDNDPGIGNGTAFSLSGGTTVNQVISLSTTSMSEGFHNMYIRVKDDLGKWSHYEKTSFYVLKNQSGGATPLNLIAGEYFFDNDPGIGNGTAFSLSGGATINQVLSISTTGMSEGFHNMYIRVKDDLGKWSHYEKAVFYVLVNVPNVPSNNFVKGEYFFDNDPGIGNGTAFTVPNQLTISNFPININTGSLLEGSHSVHIRFMDDKGKWSHYETRPFYICGDLIDQPSIMAGSTVFCQGEQINVTGIPVNDISSVFWTGPNNYFLQSVVLVRNGATPAMSGTYTFHVVSAGGFNCDTNTVSVNVTVNPSYSLYQQKTLCFGDTLKIGDSEYTQSGFYSKTLTSVLGCDSTISVSLNVLPLNKHAQVVQRCTGQTYTIGNHTYTSSGTYTDTLVSYLGCDSIVITNLFIGDPILNTEITFQDSTLTAQADDVLYQWFDCEDGMTAIPNATNKTLQLTKNGKYAVRLTSTLCPDITTTSDCFEATNLNVSSYLAFDNIKVYPNPNQGLVYVSANDYQDVFIELLDLQGRLLQTSTMTNTLMQIDLSQYASGNYLLRINKAQATNIYKITKEN